MKIAQIALDVPLRRLFDYLVPAEMHSQIMLGARVKVPFGRQFKVGLVIGLVDESEFELAKLKPINQLVDQQALFSAGELALLHWLTQYYLCPPGEAYINLLPKKIKAGESSELAKQQIWFRTDTSSAGIAANAAKQLAAINLLEQHKQLTLSELKAFDISKVTLTRLAELGYVDSKWQLPSVAINKRVEFTPADYPLNDEQQIAVTAISEKINNFGVFLLEGVTGSGKTEVYIQALNCALQQQQQVLVLVPEIGLTPQTLQRFAERFATEIAVLHSELNDTERYQAWLKARSGQARIVIGTRSAVLVPMPDLGLIVLDEEHDLSFKQQDSLRYNARDVAIKRAHLTGVPIILGSATPSLETLKNAFDGRYQRLLLTKRATQFKPPKPLALDIKDQPLNTGLAPRVIELIGEHLKAGNQVLVFLNRRGYSPALLCHECGWVSKCPRCDSHFTFHKAIRQLHCHHCGNIAPVPHQCSDCGSTQIIDWGVGTEKLEHWLSEKFVDYSILRIDRDNVRRKGELAQKLTEVQQGEHQLLIGTQMLAKGHHFPQLTLTVIVNLDNALFSADFRATERMAQLMIQVAGRAGRGDKPGQVILQTHQPNHPVLQLLTQQDYAKLQQYLLSERQSMALPPYQHWALIRAECHQQEKVLAFCQQLAQLAQSYIEHHYPDVMVLPAMPAIGEKRAGKYRYLTVFEAPERKSLNALLLQLSIQLESDKTLQQVRWIIDIDPQDVS